MTIFEDPCELVSSWVFLLVFCPYFHNAIELGQVDSPWVSIPWFFYLTFARGDQTSRHEGRFLSFGPPEMGAEPLRRVQRALKAMSTPSRARVSLRFMGPQDRLWGAIQPLITLVFPMHFTG